jgi:hypothetical protein
MAAPSRCPIDNGLTREHRAEASLLVCDDCSETLYPTELVRRATWLSRRRYLAGGTTDTRTQDARRKA